ncbi:MAG: helix-hairpin-helix domain-containing protein [Acidobacteriota bacterium]
MMNSEVAAILRRIADLMELQKGDQFKIRSYRTAADSITGLQTPLSELAARGGAAELRKLPGIGDAISKRIVDLLETGTTEVYEQLRAVISETVLDLLQIGGVGMKTLEVLHHQFKVRSLDDFAKFVAGGGLESVPRLGEKTRARIRAALTKRGYQIDVPGDATS